MVVDIAKLIAAISPEVFCDSTPDDEGVPRNAKVRKIVDDELKRLQKKIDEKKANGEKITPADKSTDIYLTAAKEAQLRDNEFFDYDLVKYTHGVSQLPGLKNPIQKNEFTYDAFSQNLEPVYYWLVDYANAAYGGSEKLVDNFISSPGSGHFSELNTKATVLHDKAMSIFGTANGVIRSILNLVYDMKEFKLRLQTYDDLKSENKGIQNAAKLSLKQVWLDNVDAKRGNSSIKGFAQLFDYVTIIDGFMAAENVDSVTKEEKDGGLDLNDRVKRILQQRIGEFERWTKESEVELRKRFDIEKIYLKSQVNSLRLYSRWLKPYLRSAVQLEQRASPASDIVAAFNVSVFELVLLAKGRPYDPAKDIRNGEIPQFFKKLKLRKYTPVTLIEFRFRTIPDRADQRGGYTFRGRVNIKFTSFGLNEEEFNVLKDQVEKDDFKDVYSFVEGANEESLGKIMADIEELLGEKEPKKEKGDSGKDENPFAALFNFKSKKEKKKEDDTTVKGVEPDSDYEQFLRDRAVVDARDKTHTLYKAFRGWIGSTAAAF